jgi:HEAT repeat protein
MLALFGCLSIASLSVWLDSKMLMVVAPAIPTLLISILTVTELRKLSRLPRLLGYPKKSVRAEAFAELMRQGEKAIPLFLQVFSVPTDRYYLWDASYARALAAFGLGRLKAQKAVEPLMTLLRERRLSLKERCAAIWALGELGDPKAIPVLLPLLGDLQSMEMDERLMLLDGLPAREKARIRLKQGWQWRIADWAADALAKLGAQHLVDDFQRALHERDDEALQRLKATFRSEVTTALMKVLDTYRHAPRLRETEMRVSNAAWALGRLKAMEAISVLRREARRSPFPSVREICGQIVRELEALARLPMPANPTEFDRTNLPAIPNPNAFPTDNLPRPANAKADEMSKV